MLRHSVRLTVAAAVLSLSSTFAFAVDTFVLPEGELLEGGTGCLGDFCNALNSDFVEEVSGVEQSDSLVPTSAGGGASGSSARPQSSFVSQASAFASVPNLSSQDVEEQIANGVLSTDGSSDETDGADGDGILSALAAVPVPATLPLLLGALGLGAMLGRKRA
ncbi:MAG: hypothetical protein AAGA87_05845 [Pseudomonadota bacterium]